MLAYSVTSSGLFPRMLWALLLLAASLNAHNDVWDEPCCTEHEVSVNRGSRVVMACNISNNLRDVTIELVTSEKTSIIFNHTPPGNYSKDSWQLHIQGVQAQLVITDAQDKHSGNYSWKLHGFQAEFKNFNLTVNAADRQKTEDLPVTKVPDKPPTAVRTEVIIIIAIATTIIITGIGVFVWYKQFPVAPQIQMSVPCLIHGSPGIPYLTLPP
uniref:Secreted and transmembrane protein 1b n=1 Tax=Mus musculus TaxID=10090 RepID=SCT1B_MOUSE|nr:RecName: Full=Secreted and transmembrane protein 1b; AltName: Full=Protein K-12; Flags: Precursor [Mus musculus]AAF30406.1 SECTM1 [Mus musculus]AAH10805.1 Sectm1b protein [Mus musculus]